MKLGIHGLWFATFAFLCLVGCVGLWLQRLERKRRNALPAFTERLLDFLDDMTPAEYEKFRSEADEIMADSKKRMQR